MKRTEPVLEGDDGSPPERAILLSARKVDGRVRIVIDRVEKVDGAWRMTVPVTFRDFDDWDGPDGSDAKVLGEVLLAELEASMPS